MFYTRGKGAPPDPVLLLALFLSLRFGLAPLILMFTAPDRPKTNARRSLIDFWRAEAPGIKRSSIIRLLVIGGLLVAASGLRWSTEPHSMGLVLRVLVSLGLGGFMVSKAAFMGRAAVVQA
jgi:hypothetical protein